MLQIVYMLVCFCSHNGHPPHYAESGHTRPHHDITERWSHLTHPQHTVDPSPLQIDMLKLVLIGGRGAMLRQVQQSGVHEQAAVQR